MRYRIAPHALRPFWMDHNIDALCAVGAVLLAVVAMCLGYYVLGDALA
jgi:hypothetical protein